MKKLPRFGGGLDGIAGVPGEPGRPNKKHSPNDIANRNRNKVNVIDSGIFMYFDYDNIINKYNVSAQIK